MTRQDLLAMLEAKTYADWFYGGYEDSEAFYRRKEIWENTHKLCNDMGVEVFPSVVIHWLWEENKL